VASVGHSTKIGPIGSVSKLITATQYQLQNASRLVAGYQGELGAFRSFSLEAEQITSVSKLITGWSSGFTGNVSKPITGSWADYKRLEANCKMTRPIGNVSKLINGDEG